MAITIAPNKNEPSVFEKGWLLRHYYVILKNKINQNVPWVSIWRIRPRRVRLGSFLDLYILTIVDFLTSEHGKIILFRKSRSFYVYGR